MNALVPSLPQRLRNSTARLYCRGVCTKGDITMSLLNGILGQVSESATVQNLAAKVGLTPSRSSRRWRRSARRIRNRATR